MVTMNIESSQQDWEWWSFKTQVLTVNWKIMWLPNHLNSIKELLISSRATDPDVLRQHFIDIHDQVDNSKAHEDQQKLADGSFDEIY